MPNDVGTDDRTIHEASDQLRSLAQGAKRAAEALHHLAYERAQLAEILAKHGLRIKRYGPEDYQWGVGGPVDDMQGGTASSFVAAVDAGIDALITDAIFIASLGWQTTQRAAPEATHGKLS